MLLTKGPRNLNTRHLKMVDMKLRGVAVAEIASNLGMSVAQVSIICNSASFQHELSTRQQKVEVITNDKIAEAKADAVLAMDEVQSSIKRGTIEAVKRVVGLISSEDDSLALKASTEILDRGGYPRVQRNDNRSVVVSISSVDAKILQETLLMDSD